MAKVEKDKKEEAGRNDAAMREAVTGYEQRLARVRAYKTLTDCPAWGELFAALRTDLAKHGTAILDAERPRDVVRHQEAVKLLRAVMAKPGEAVEDLQAYCRALPLFAAEYRTQAAWNADLGKIEIRTV